MRVLIAGATGQTGRHLTEEVIHQGHEVVALARDSSDTSGLPDTVDIRIADLENLDLDVVNGVDAVIFAAGSGSSTGTDKTKAVDRDGAKSLINHAANSGIGKFVMLSSIGADAPQDGPEEMRPYLEAKHEADMHLMKSGIPYAIVRPVSLTNEDATGQVEIDTHVDQSAEVTRGDVATALAAALTDPAFENRVVEMRNC